MALLKGVNIFLGVSGEVIQNHALE